MLNNSISFGGVSLALGGSDATPAFNLSAATGYPTGSLDGTITNAQLAGSITNDRLANNSISFGGVSLALGGSDATPAFNLSDATGYPTGSLDGTITNAQLAGSITNDRLANNSISFGGVSLALGGSDATPAFNLSAATGYPTGSLDGTITNAQLAGSITNDRLSNNSISFGGVSLALGGSDATPAFNLSDATGYPTGSLDGTITNAQLAGNISNDRLANNSISFGGVSLALGGTDATPAFDLSDATNYPTSSLDGTITNAQLAGNISNDRLANNSISFGGVSLALGGTDATPAFDLSDATNYPTSNLAGTITNAQLAGSITNDKLAHNSITIGSTSVTLGSSSTTFDDVSLNKPTIINDATNGGYIELLEGSDNGSNYLRLKAPNSIGSNIVLTFPDNDGDNTNVLQTDGSGNLSWVAKIVDLRGQKVKKVK